MYVARLYMNEYEMKMELKLTDSINANCPWSGEPVQVDALTEYNGMVAGFCNPDGRDRFDAAIRCFEHAAEKQGVVHKRFWAATRPGRSGRTMTGI